jgi:predicted RecA/RadA family phage recombinase
MAITTATRTPSTKVYLEPGDATTCLAGGAITVGRFVKVTTGSIGNHPKVIHATPMATGVGGAAYGVAHYTAVSGSDVSVLREGTVGVEAGEAITSGDEVAVGTNGVAMKATAALKPVGVATADIALGVLGPVTLY